MTILLTAIAAGSVTALIAFIFLCLLTAASIAGFLFLIWCIT